MTNEEIKEAIQSRRYFECDKYSTIRIMAFVENNFMVRRKEGMAFVLTASEFEGMTGISLAYR